jgi:hypothetical protein
MSAVAAAAGSAAVAENSTRGGLGDNGIGGPLEEILGRKAGQRGG